MSEEYRFNHSVKDRRQVFYVSKHVPSQQAFREYMNPVTRWCYENFGPVGRHSSARWRVKINHWEASILPSSRISPVWARIVFRKEADALAFKLRWG